MNDQFSRDIEAAIAEQWPVRLVGRHFYFAEGGDKTVARVVLLREHIGGGVDTSIYCDGCSSFRSAERIAFNKNLAL